MKLTVCGCSRGMKGRSCFNREKSNKKLFGPFRSWRVRWTTSCLSPKNVLQRFMLLGWGHCVQTGLQSQDGRWTDGMNVRTMHTNTRSVSLILSKSQSARTHARTHARTFSLFSFSGSLSQHHLPLGPGKPGCPGNPGIPGSPASPRKPGVPA